MAILIDMGIPENCDNCDLCSVKWTADDDSSSWAYCHPASRQIVSAYSGDDRIVARELLDKPEWCPLKDVPGNNHEKFTEDEKWRISDIFQNYYCMGIGEIAEESETCKSIFQKVGLIDG